MDHQWAESDGDPRTGQGPEKGQECRRDRNTPGQRHCETRCLQFRFMVSSSMARIIAVSRSSSPTHDTHWRPGPTRPPRPNRTSCASFAVAGSLRPPSPMPVRSSTVPCEADRHHFPRTNAGGCRALVEDCVTPVTEDSKRRRLHPHSRPCRAAPDRLADDTHRLDSRRDELRIMTSSPRSSSRAAGVRRRKPDPPGMTIRLMTSPCRRRAGRRVEGCRHRAGGLRRGRTGTCWK